MSTIDETERLLPSTSISVGKPRVSYRSVVFDSHVGITSQSHTPEASLQMEPIDDSGKSLGGEPHDKIIYTWSDVNVYAATTNIRFWDRMFCKNSQGTIQQKHLLKDVCGVAYPGELLVIMGSSGAGKTTLLNTLTFRSGRGVTTSGTMAANGQRVTSSVLTSRMAYVQQDDLFIGTLTVQEHLLFQARVRMNRQIPFIQRVQRVDEVISELALTKCRNTVIGIPGRLKGLSGGEMKRLSFASEVLTDPPLMFCDEPTSGLDSFMAHQVVSVLKALTARGKTIVTTLHQPSSELFSLFDKILLMAEGRVAFMGTGEQACLFFKTLGAACPSNYNPADYFVQILAVVPGREISCRQTINTICDTFQKSAMGTKIALEAGTIQGEYEDLVDWKIGSSRGTSPYKASWCEQFRAVLWRSWLSVIKEPILIKVRFLQTVMVSLLIGTIFFGQRLDQDGVMNINGAIFIFLTNMTFQNVFAVINVFCAELPIFLREQRNGMYRTDVYFLCKTLAEAPIFIAVPLIFSFISYPLIHLYPSIDRFFIAAGIITLVANVATSFGYLISCASSSMSMALSVGPPIIIPFLLFGGFFLNTASVPKYFKWFSYLSWFRYGNEALLINQWSEVDSIACIRSNTTCPKSGDMVLQIYNFKKEDFLMDITCLICLIIAFRFLAFLALLSKTYRSPVYGIFSLFKWEKYYTKYNKNNSKKLSFQKYNAAHCRRLFSMFQKSSTDFRGESGIRGVTLTWQNVSVYAMDRNRSICKQLINNVRGALKPGDLTAILGGSGSGKSSLMTALAFRTPPGVIVHGGIRANGREVDLSYMRHHSGFMHQEDVFIGTMTVLEHLWFMARMKLDRRMVTWEIRQRIEALLREVGLAARHNVRIGNGGDKVLSGGERKRLAFATEQLLTDPRILFLDEPTTGLDAHSASFLISQLTSIANRGRTVLCTIHQPSSAIFNLFHKIILVADGRIAFAGSSEQAIQFFANLGYECPVSYNPADFLVATLAIAPKQEDSSRRAAQRICDAFLSSDASKEIDVTIQLELHVGGTVSQSAESDEIGGFKQPNCWTRMFWLTHRGFMQVLRDPSVQLLRMVQKMSVATVAGLCFVGTINLDQLGIQAVQGVIFILVAENTFFPMYSTLALIPQELPLFLREYRAGMYPAYVYYTSKVLSLIPGLIIEPIIFGVVVYWLAGLRDTAEAFGLTLIILIFTMNVSTACGCFFSAAFENVPVAMAYLVPFDYVLMVTMGLFAKLDSLPIYIRWLKYISWLLHSTEALSIVQWRNIQNISCVATNPDLPCITNGSDVLEHYDFNENNFWPDLVLMALMYMIFHLLGYFCLWRRCRAK
ncbi:ABC transporter G family member 3-like [Belonocnema kinseyi]|uniref:ABC transporter G family member 3-like n=1 Tax=Belonocnema kinseyi TaxID=2817044 RepID=UPI00143CD220|nr:ABC transporter G family member 3-like [Belonocnema kinseyi]